ncbi:MAG: class I SAM-dependent methyltransferase [Anaerolineae bacterium]|nr:class I SAM-dependent methyltransferase [Anaerolineae bacterium]
MNNRIFSEIQSGNRFTFGKNWADFLTRLNEDRILSAQKSLRDMLKLETLDGKRFIDIGSGSGLFSLAARRLGAHVYSFDYDPQSTACTAELKRRYFPDDAGWQVTTGSVLDINFLNGLGQADVVYSWGVLHHTGLMYQAFKNIVPLVAPGGQLFIAIYNNQGFTSKYWLMVKKIYNRSLPGRWLITAFHFPYLFVLRWIFRFLTGRRSLERGMSLWHDMIDWLGGYPFEVASPEDIFHYFYQQNFILEELKTCAGKMGCNEFVFRKAP